MNTILIFIWIYGAMIALSFIEAYAEGRNSWDKRKVGWKIILPGGYKFLGYHFFLFLVMIPLFLTLPLVVYGWNKELFGILLSAFFSGIVIEDFVYFIVNPVVKFKEFFSEFTDYYPWIKIRGKKIIPVGYIIGITLAILSWYFLWR
jgi:hypothetical protein